VEDEEKLTRLPSLTEAERTVKEGSGWTPDGDLTETQLAEIKRRIKVDNAVYETKDEYMQYVEDVRTRKHLSWY
jgi:hypothetical protein